MNEIFKYELWGEEISFNRKLNEIETLFLSVLSKSDTSFYRKIKNRNNIDIYVKEKIEKLVTIIERRNKISCVLKNKQYD